MKVRTIKLENGEIWAVPVAAIARDRAKNYASEFDNDIERSLKEDTEPLFAEDPFEIQDWAANNMNWEDVSAVAFRVEGSKAAELDFQEAWVNGHDDIKDIDDSAVPPHVLEALEEF